MSNSYAPCFNRINFVVILSYIELPWINSIRAMYVLHNLQGHTSSFRDLINFLNLLAELLYLILLGRSSQIFWPRYLTDCKSLWLWAVFIFSLLSWLLDDLKLNEIFCCSKISFIIAEANLFLSTKISVTKTCKFLWCAVTELSRSRHSEKLKLFW